MFIKLNRDNSIKGKVVLAVETNSVVYISAKPECLKLN